MNLSAQEVASLLSEAGLPVSRSLADGLASYLELLLKWNARTNLTAIRTPREIILRHFADSLFCAGHISPSAHTLLDFGSGGGFPGIPIAIAQPKLRVTLAESQNRKAAFLREAVRSLGLNAEVWSGRVEYMAANQVYDVVTLRAVDRMESACQAASLKVAPGGQMLVFTTQRLQSFVTSSTQSLHWQNPVRLPHSEQGLLLIGLR